MACPSDQSTPTGVIRNLTPADQAGGLKLSTEASWNQNASDWQLLAATCWGRGMAVAGCGLVGTAMVWPLSGDYAWINMVLVTPDHRGRGIARSLMENLLQEIENQGRIAFLDATEMGEGLYRKLGFRDGPRLLRLRRESAATNAPKPTTAGLRPMRPADLEAVASLDHATFGLDRRELLENFLTRCPLSAWVAESAAGQIEGFVTARNGRLATQLGPVVARDRGQAECLLQAALQSIDGPAILDVPAVDTAWLEAVKAVGFVVQRGFMRMTRGEHALATDWSRYFAISGPDFA
ncbi:MAG: GNAT family N-acetyltransferase [Opitutaceae bacterium]|nr:GNAT family N-acetyltransferase [Cephaloticoccus sp.]MCP5529434.1 GNAT family N-acetyltransferase [Opitutaceae bacterium]